MELYVGPFEMYSYFFLLCFFSTDDAQYDSTAEEVLFFFRRPKQWIILISDFRQRSLDMYGQYGPLYFVIKILHDLLL